MIHAIPLSNPALVSFTLNFIFGVKETRERDKARFPVRQHQLRDTGAILCSTVSVDIYTERG